ncbi:hypothetical protein [Sphingopyxis yananensis]|uniref:hypothetical protein n=1 Tax=Sphingopyxis yananensis TaxID=2886687 RepID=UPI001D122178|nr:hypothetical protein [Sphingopyxis yananensis]MCC2601640.1 hypothetical protein [Sphingopyxis yananensis]
MKNIILSAMATASLLASPSVMASEAYITATGGLPYSFTGTFDVFKGINIVGCNVVLTVTGPDGTGDGKHAATPPRASHVDIASIGSSNVTLSFSGGTPAACAAGVQYVGFSSVSYTPTAYNNGVLTFHNLNLNTPLTPNGCYGDLPLTWDGVKLSASGTLPDRANPGVGPDCHFTGDLYADDTSTLFSVSGDFDH